MNLSTIFNLQKGECYRGSTVCDLLLKCFYNSRHQLQKLHFHVRKLTCTFTFKRKPELNFYLSDTHPIISQLKVKARVRFIYIPILYRQPEHFENIHISHRICFQSQGRSLNVLPPYPYVMLLPN